MRLVPRPTAAADLAERVGSALAEELAAAGAAPGAIRVECVDEIEREPGDAAKLKLVTAAR